VRLVAFTFRAEDVILYTTSLQTEGLHDFLTLS